MGRKRTGFVYRNKANTLRFRYPLPDGFLWDQEVPPTQDGGPLDETWGERVLAIFRGRVEGGWDPRTIEAQPIPAAPQTIGEYVMAWIKTQTYEDARIDARRLVLHFLPAPLAQLRLTEARPRHCLDYVRWLLARPSAEGGTLAPRTIRTIANVVQRGLAQAVRDELLAVTPWNLPPKAIPARTDKHLGEREGWVFTMAEVQALCYSRVIPEDRRAIYATLFLGCCRTGEVSALRVEDWDRARAPLGALAINKSRSQTRRAVKGTKTEVSRHVPVHPALAALLAEWVLSGLPKLLGRPATPEDLLFPSKQTGRERAQTSIHGSLQVDLDKLDMRGRRAHDARRTHISLLVDAGARREVFSVWTHGRKGDVVSSYTSAAWSTFCAEMMRLEFGRLTEQRAVAGEDKIIYKMIEVDGAGPKSLKGFVEGGEPRMGLEPTHLEPQISSSPTATTLPDPDSQGSTAQDSAPQDHKIIPITLFPLNNFWTDEGEQSDFIESLFSEEDTHV
jgi:integrase